MKRPMTIAVFMMFAVTGYSQRYLVSTNFERTSISPKTGVSIGMITADTIGFEFGLFYQESHLLDKITGGDNEKIEDLPRFYERQFYGIFASYPVWKKGIFSLKMNVRTGVMNNQNFLITPSVISDIQVYKNISVEVGVGTRCFSPTLRSSLKIRI